MSGALAQHRPANKPMEIGGVPVLKFDKYGKPVMKHVLRPGGVYKDGRPTEYQVLRYVATRHENVLPVEQNRPSKHARARMRPRTADEQRRYDRAMARAVQASKSMIVDFTKLRAVYDEMPAG